MRGRGASQLSQLWGGVQRKGEGAQVSLVSFGGGVKGKGRESAWSALGGRKEEGARVVPAWFYQVLRGWFALRGGPGWFEVRFHKISPPVFRQCSTSVPPGSARAAGWSGVALRRFHKGSTKGSTRVPPGSEFRPCRTWWTLVSWNLTSNLAEPGGIWSNPGGDHHCPCRTWWNRGGTLVEPCLKPPRTTPQPSQNLVERWWNFRGTLPQTTPDYRRTPVWNPRLVEPYIKPPPRRIWWNPGSPRCPRRMW